jgi:pantothenate kinase
VCKIKTNENHQKDPGTNKTMTLALDAIRDRIQSLLTTQTRVMVAIAGCPGSGKTHTAAKLATHLQLADAVQVVSMDGWHYYRHELDRMPDPELAHRRRGAPFTFDAERFVEQMQLVRQSAGVADVKCPSFDHAEKDPRADAIVIAADVRVVIVEGLYCLLGEEPWNRLESVFDVSVWIECELETAMDRMVRRRIDAMGQSDSDARDAVANNDRLNAEHVLRATRKAEFTVENTRIVFTE